MKIIFVGNFMFHSVGEPEIAASLESIGHEVIRIQENEVGVGDIQKEVGRGCDLVLFAKFRTKDTYTARQAFLEGLKVPSVCWVFDLYFGL